MSAGLRRAMSSALMVCFLSPWPSTVLAGWRTFGIREGLGDLRVRAVVEDESGRLWFATAHGVSRYDGASWRTFTATAKIDSGLASDDATALEVDRRGRIWVGTAGGLSRFDGVGWTTFTRDSGLASNNVLALHEDRAGRLWVGTSFGVSRYDSAGWTTYHVPELGAEGVISIEDDLHGALWFGTDGGGVSRFYRGAWQTFTVRDTTVPDNKVSAIHEDRAGVLWFGTSGGVGRYDGRTWTRFARTGSSDAGILLTSVSSIVEDARGNVWFGTANGVVRFDGRSWTFPDTSEGLVIGGVTAMRIDRSGNLWVSTLESGVGMYDRVGWSLLNKYPLGPGVRAVFEDSTGALWFGTPHGGAVRFDRDSGLTVYDTTNVLAGQNVFAILADSTPALWFGTNAGASRLDALGRWTPYTKANSGLVGDEVHALLGDRSGHFWFGTATGLSSFDGTHWRSFTVAESLVADNVQALLEDRAGQLWVGTTGGVSRRDTAGRWTAYTTANSPLLANEVHAMVEDRAGRVWIGTSGGISVWDGSGWGLNHTTSPVFALAEDFAGVLWVGTSGGSVSRFDGATWYTYLTRPDRIPDATVTAVIQERSGDMWFGATGGAVHHEPDRAPPQTVISPAPPALSASRLQTFTFTAGFEEQNVEFQHALDGIWSAWSPDKFWIANSLGDGRHVFEVRGRDAIGNIDATPDTAIVEIDATPPTPLVSFPVYGQPVRDSITIVGTAADARFVSYRIDSTGAGASGLLTQSSTPVTAGVLAGWNTTQVPDGDYTLRLAVTDALGLTGTALVRVIVDNHLPAASVTTPARVSAALGGDVYSTRADVHLYFPPHAFGEDAIVSITPAAVGGSGPPLNGVTEIDSIAWSIAWGAEHLVKHATLEMAFDAASTQAGWPVLYVSVDGATWTRVGGTVDRGSERVSADLTQAGRYALFSQTGPVTGPGTLSGLSLTPRVFSAAGAFASRDVAIGFTLARAAQVSVKIFNRAGRLVREVVTGSSLGPGVNLVRWDGRDRDGRDAAPGLYVVTVEALGQTRERTLAVVR